MPSALLTSLASRLADADELALLAGSASGTAEQASARASVVLMHAAFEGFVEDLFRECAGLLVNAADVVLNPLRERPLARFNNPTLPNVDDLFEAVGLSNITTGVQWTGTDEQTVRSDFGQIKTIRHQVAHGTGVPTVPAPLLSRYRDVIIGVAAWLDDRVADFVKSVTGTQPW